MKAVFLSDAHIRGHDDPNLPPLLGFLRRLQGTVNRVYIVGDLFDTWFGFPKAVFDEYVPLLGALCELKESGVRIVYVTGNHDFEMGAFFTEILGAEIHDSELVLEEDGRRAYVAHGDMVNAADHGYRRLRRILRSAPMRWLGRNLPPRWVWAIAAMLTEKYTGAEVARRMPLQQIFRSFAEQQLREGFDTVILGHLHLPVQETLPMNRLPLDSSSRARYSAPSYSMPPAPRCATDEPATGTYVNLGDWVKERTFLRWEAGQLSLRRWAWPQNVEQPV